MNKQIMGIIAAVVIVMLVVFGLGLLTGTKALSLSTPATVIGVPASNSEYHAGEAVQIQSTSTDPSGITRVELAVDGSVIYVDEPLQPQTTFTVTQPWIAFEGKHTISMRAYNSSNQSGNLAQITVTVLTSVAAETHAAIVTVTVAAAPSLTVAPPETNTPVPVPALAPSQACDSSAFVADVTVPDRTTLATGQTFNKIWRVLNTGTCTWGNGYTFTWVAGDLMGAPQTITVPYTLPGSTADLLVPMTADLVPGSFAGFWQLRNPTGGFFGVTSRVVTNVIVLAVPTNVPSCSGSPTIESFSVSPSTIVAGESATLNWGLVGNAVEADIDNGIGGVPTPGGTSVSPGSTTIYTLTGHCGANTVNARVTLTVLTPTAALTPMPAAPTPTLVVPTVALTAIPPTPTTQPVATALPTPTPQPAATPRITETPRPKETPRPTETARPK
jgi:hypothetical protein